MRRHKKEGLRYPGREVMSMPLEITLTLTLRDSSKDTLVVLKDDCVSEMMNKEAFNMVGCLEITLCSAIVGTNKQTSSYTRTIIKDPKEIVELRSHKYAMVGYPLLAIIKLDTPMKKPTGCKFCWERVLDHPSEHAKDSRCKSDNVLLSVKRRYIPVDDDVGARIKFKCMVSTTYEDISGASIKVCQYKECVFDAIQHTPKHFISPLRFKTESSLLKVGVQQKYRTMTYNILHEKLGKKEVTCSNYYPAIDYRQQIIAKEIIQSNADIVCLQECALDVFEYLSAYLTYTGMYDEGHFLKKRNGSDGCAMFYNMKKFSIVEYCYIYIADQYPENCYSEFEKYISKGDFNKLRSLPQVAQYLLLRPLHSSTKDGVNLDKNLLVSNTHLTYLPNLENLRNLQCDAILKQAAKIVSERSQCGISVGYIFSGDLNSTVETGIIQYLCKGILNTDHDDFVIAASEVTHGGDADYTKALEEIVNSNKWGICDNLKLLNLQYGNQWRTIRFKLLKQLEASVASNSNLQDMLRAISNGNIKHYCLLLDKAEAENRASGIHIKMGNLPIRWKAEKTGGANNKHKEEVLSHSFSFLPSFDFRTGSQAHLAIPITVWTHTFRGTLDYIFFHGIQDMYLLPTEVKNDFANNDKAFSMPNKHYPSDHLSVVCEFQL